LTEIPIADVVDNATSADAAPDLCHFAVWLRRQRVPEESPEKDDKRESLGVRLTLDLFKRKSVYTNASSAVEICTDGKISVLPMNYYPFEALSSQCNAVS